MKTRFKLSDGQTFEGNRGANQRLNRYLPNRLMERRPWLGHDGTQWLVTLQDPFVQILIPARVRGPEAMATYVCLHA